MFVPSYEVHGTVNTTDKPARLMSFQSPPDMALYRGERDHSSSVGSPDIPKPENGHRSAVQIITMAKGGPVFGDLGFWRSVVSPERGSKHLAMDYIKLGSGESFDHEPVSTEGIYVLTDGKAVVKSGGNKWELVTYDVIFLVGNDRFSLSQIGDAPTTLVHCWALE